MKISENPDWLASIESFERRVYSQNGEDGVLEYLFSNIVEAEKCFVEIGAGDGAENNSRRLEEELQWSGVRIDAMHANERVRGVHVTRSNINQILASCGVPDSLGLLSIDVDGMDYWLWDACAFSPDVVVVEYNATLGMEDAITVPYADDFRWDHLTNYFGASLAAFVELGIRKGYGLVYCESKGVNAFFVSYKHIDPSKLPPLAALYRPPRYGPEGQGFPVCADGKWQTVECVRVEQLD